MLDRLVSLANTTPLSSAMKYAMFGAVFENLVGRFDGDDISRSPKSSLGTTVYFGALYAQSLTAGIAAIRIFSSGKAGRAALFSFVALPLLLKGINLTSLSKGQLGACVRDIDRLFLSTAAKTINFAGAFLSLKNRKLGLNKDTLGGLIIGFALGADLARGIVDINKFGV